MVQKLWTTNEVSNLKTHVSRGSLPQTLHGGPGPSDWTAQRPRIETKIAVKKINEMIFNDILLYSYIGI